MNRIGDLISLIVLCRTFDDFLYDGMVEYLDCNEENDALIAVYEKDINMLVEYILSLKLRLLSLLLKLLY